MKTKKAKRGHYQKMMYRINNPRKSGKKPR